MEPPHGKTFTLLHAIRVHRDETGRQMKQSLFLADGFGIFYVMTALLALNILGLFCFIAVYELFGIWCGGNSLEDRLMMARLDEKIGMSRGRIGTVFNKREKKIFRELDSKGALVIEWLITTLMGVSQSAFDSTRVGDDLGESQRPHFFFYLGSCTNATTIHFHSCSTPGAARVIGGTTTSFGA